MNRTIKFGLAATILFTLYFCFKTEFIQNSELSPQEMASQLIKKSISSNKVFVFSKTYCPYCKRVKSLFSQINLKYGLLELDQHVLGNEIQQELGRMTGATSVPRVFINEQFIGGSDATMAAHANGSLMQKLKECGALD
eukprot:TRINITY_DN37_c0_g3_i1.p1 TRINITY_DN37_c0_g3~~TRINITY_DN37_c0_g3_i1.p1  ORF type:complete len:139 (-),score=56.18 TRINITY_DN37_c0_g3_i1:56-472(-)